MAKYSFNQALACSWYFMNNMSSISCLCLYLTVKIQSGKAFIFNGLFLILYLLFTLFRLFFISFHLGAGPVDSFTECRYWCRSKASVAKVLNWHDRAVKEQQRSILPSFTLQHSPRGVHLLHTVADKRRRYWTHFLRLSRTLSRESRRSLILHSGVCTHIVKFSVVSLVKEMPVIGYWDIGEGWKHCWSFKLGLRQHSMPALLTWPGKEATQAPHMTCVFVRACRGNLTLGFEIFPGH